MRFVRITIICILTLLATGTISACRTTYYKVPVVKNKKRFSPYDQKRDRWKKRTKITKYKSLKRTKHINDN